MAEEIESLLIASDFDPAGLYRSLTATERRLDQFDNTIRDLMSKAVTPNVDPRPLEAALGEMRGAVAETLRVLEAAGGGQLASTFADAGQQIAATAGQIVLIGDAETDVARTVEQSGQTWRAFVAERLAETTQLTGSTGAALQLLAGQWQELQASVTATVPELQAIAPAADAAAAGLNAMAAAAPDIGAAFQAAREGTTGLVQEILDAANMMRNELGSAIAGAGLDRQAAAAASATFNTFQTELVDRLADLRAELALDIIDPRQFATAADQALEQFSTRAQALARSLPPIRIRGEIDIAGGVKPNMIDPAQIKAAEEAYAGLASQAGFANNAAAKLSETNSRSSVIFSGTGRSVNRLGTSFAILATQLLNVPGPIGHIVTALLLLGAGSAVMTGVAAGVALVAGAYRYLNAASIEAAEKQKKLRESLRQRVEADIPAPVLTGKELLAAQQELEKVQKRIHIATVQINDAEVDGIAKLFILARLRHAEYEEAKLLHDIQGGIVLKAREEIQQQNELAQIRRQQAAALSTFANQVADMTTNQLKFGDSTRLVAAQMQFMLQISRDVNKGWDERLAAAAAYRSLLDATLRPAERAGAAVANTAQNQLQIFNRLAQQQEQLNAPVTIRADVTQAARALDVLRAQVETNADRVARLRAGIADQSSDAAQRLLAEERQWRSLGVGITDALAGLDRGKIDNATAGLDRLVAQVQRASERDVRLTVPLEINTTQAFQQVLDVQKDLAARADAFRSVNVEPPRELLDKLEQVTAQIDAALRTPITALIRNADLITGKLHAMQSAAEEAARVQSIDTGRDPTAADQAALLERQAPLLTLLAARHDEIARKLQDEKLPLVDQIDLLNEQLDIQRQLDDARPQFSPELTGQITSLQQAADAYREAHDQLAIAQRVGTFQEVQTAEASIRQADTRMRTVRTNILATLHAQGASAGVIKQVMTAIDAAFGRAGRSLDDLSEGAKEVRTVMSDVGAIASAADRVASAWGGVDDVLQTVIRSTGELAADIKAVAEDASFGNIVGLVGAGLSFLGGLFGKSESAKMRDAVLEQNNQRLAELRVALDAHLQGVTGLERARQAALATFTTKGGNQADVFGMARILQQFGGKDAGIKFINEQLADLGLNFQDLNELAKQNGIQLLDSKGRIVAGAFDQLAEAMQLTIQQMTTFNDTLDDQLHKRQLEARLNGQDISDPRNAFALELDAIRGISPAINDAFKGIDLGNADAVRSTLRDLLSKFDEGFFTAHPDLFGGLTKDQFLAFLDQGADYLDSFNKALGDATKTIDNAPEGFKLADFEWAAQLPQLPPGVLPPREPRGIDLLPRGDVVSAGAPSASIGGASTGAITVAGDVHIYVDGAGSPEDVADRVLFRFQQDSLSRYGTTDRWAGGNLPQV